MRIDTLLDLWKTSFPSSLGSLPTPTDTPAEPFRPLTAMIAMHYPDRYALTDRQIAEARYISHRTAEWHVRNVFGTLGADNRAEAAALATRDQLI